MNVAWLLLLLGEWERGNALLQSTKGPNSMSKRTWIVSSLLTATTLLGCAAQLDEPESAAGPPGPEAIRSQVRGQFSGIRQCSETALANNPELGGKVVIWMELHPDGRADMSMKESSLGDTTADGCILDEMRKAEFGTWQGSGKVTVAYPIELTPRELSRSRNDFSASDMQQAHPLRARRQ